MALTNKTIAATYKDLLYLDNANAGLTSSARAVKDGAGQSSGLYLASGKVLFKPASDDTAAFQVQNAAGSALLTVDTTNSLLKVGAGQIDPTTRYYEFIANDIQPNANTHMALSSGGDDSLEAAFFGTGTDPATSYASTGAYAGSRLVDKFWYVHDNITVDAVNIYVCSDAAGSDTLRFHLMYFTIDSSLDLTAGQIIADGSDISNLGYERGYQQTMSIDATYKAVPSGKVIMGFIRADSSN